MFFRLLVHNFHKTFSEENTVILKKIPRESTEEGCNIIMGISE